MLASQGYPEPPFWLRFRDPAEIHRGLCFATNATGAERLLRIAIVARSASGQRHQRRAALAWSTATAGHVGAIALDGSCLRRPPRRGLGVREVSGLGAEVRCVVQSERHRVPTDWRTMGVRVVGSDELDTNTPQTPGMTRAAAVTTARAGAEKLWAGTVIIEPDAKTGAHHHGPVESVIYVVSGRVRMRWCERLEYVAEAGPGDFIYFPPNVPHQEINTEPSQPLSCVLARSGQEPVVVNLDLADVEPNPQQVHWVDDIHPAP
jgi:uncharacterized RmlC-like cupin family protein